MCGIAAYFGHSKIPQHRLAATVQAMSHRGPDGNGIHSVGLQNINIQLIHTRLSIIDLESRSNQPWIEGEDVLIFNGEIYNYIELRDQLKNQGYRFRTQSDTEVLSNALRCWGTSAFEYLEGMWALIWYDAKNRQLIVSRDRFGEKPLYFTRNKDDFYFASELGALFELVDEPLEINQQQVFRYLVNGYKSLHKTKEEYYQNVSQVPSGEYWILKDNGGLETHTYWNNKIAQDNNFSYDDAVTAVRERFIESVRIRSRSDVPLAYCLSGGVDSNAIISVATKVLGLETHGFTIMNSDKRYEEEDLIKTSVEKLGIDHTEIHLDKSDFLKNMSKIIQHRKQPISTISYYVHWLLMRSMNSAGFKVSFSGTAADELFSGYYDHHNLYLSSIAADASNFKKEKMAWLQNTGKFVRNPFLQNPELFITEPKFRDHIYLDNHLFASFLNIDWMEIFQETNYLDDNMRNRMMNEMFEESVPIILKEDDMNAMYFSIENRSPFLDRKLFELAHTIPTKHLIREGRGKAILRDAMEEIVIPEILNATRKVGFNAPILELFDISDTQNKEFLLDESDIYNFIKKEKIESLIKKDELKNSESKFLFNVLNVKLMYDRV